RLYKVWRGGPVPLFPMPPHYRPGLGGGGGAESFGGAWYQLGCPGKMRREHDPNFLITAPRLSLGPEGNRGGTPPDLSAAHRRSIRDVMPRSGLGQLWSD